MNTQFIAFGNKLFNPAKVSRVELEPYPQVVVDCEWIHCPGATQSQLAAIASRTCDQEGIMANVELTG